MGASWSASYKGKGPGAGRTVRVMSYNVEWGFLELSECVYQDACGHPIPKTEKAQKDHLDLVGKDIGLMHPDVCFLQEMGSLEAVEYIRDFVEDKFGIQYSAFYSNGSKVGEQGIGLLLQDWDHFTVTEIPGFPMDRAIAVTCAMPGSDAGLVIVGVHLKSIGDFKKGRDVAEQLRQIEAVRKWIGERHAIVCGDFNNIPESLPVRTLVEEHGYYDLLASDKFIPNVTRDMSTEFYRDGRGILMGARIDYVLATPAIAARCTSANIVSFHREVSRRCQDKSLRAESSDHLPVMAIFQV